jgi:D-alanyl-D-alanine carboxypeptidase
MLRRIAVFFFTMLFLLAPSASQAEHLKGFVDQFLKASGAPGVSVSVMRKGQTRPETLAAGKACIDNDVAVSEQTVMKVGSVTKLFTALRIQMLIAEGKLGYDTPMSRFFPQFPRASEITIQHLLTHTSGLPEMLMVEPLHSDFGRAWKPEEILDMVAKAPLEFTPGTKGKYSNTGYLVLGLIIEKVTGHPYAREIVDTIAKPLGMTALSAGDDQTIIPHESCGYAKNQDGTLRKPMLASMVPPFATGDLLMTSGDLVRLVNEGAVFKGDLLDNPPTKFYTLKDGRPAEKHEHFLDMSYDKGHSEGFFVWRFKDRPMTLIGKLGMFPGFSSCFFYDPQTEYAVAVVTNLETAVMDAMQMSVRILEEKRASEKR